jgi:putative ABC transport system substrate-binding protein
MRRREFIAGLSGTAVMPFAAPAQQGVPVVGFVRSTTAKGFRHLEAGLRQGLGEAGFVEGRNVAVEYRYADGHVDRLPVLIADLIRRPVAVIVANQIAALAAKTVTTAVPIVFASGTDPVQNGLVASLNRPGGNVTGAVFFGPELGSKRLELLRQVAPNATTIAVLVYPNNPLARSERNDILAAAQAVGQRLLVLDVHNERELQNAITTAAQSGVGALLIGAAAFLNAHREQLAALAARHKLPTMFPFRDVAESNGLMSYGGSQTDAYRQAGIYAGRILTGEKPADLPVIRSTKLEFVINLKTAKALGIQIPDRVLALADEVIE